MPTGTPAVSSSVPDLLIVGAGIMGVSVAWAAAEAGLSYTIVDANQPSGSRAALALLRGSWANGPEELAMTREALAAYAARGLLEFSGATWRNQGKERHDRDWYAVDPKRVLSTVSPIRAEVTAVQPYRVTARTSELTARVAVICCTGADLISGVETPLGRRNWGATALLPPASYRGVTATQLRPYHAVGLIAGPDGRRFGSSSAAEEHPARLALRRDAEAVKLDLSVGFLLTGRRYFATIHRLQLAPGLHWCGGLGRLGFALAPAIGRQLIGSL